MELTKVIQLSFNYQNFSELQTELTVLLETSYDDTSEASTFGQFCIKNFPLTHEFICAEG